MPTLRDKAVRYLASHVEEILSKQNEQGEFWPDAGFRAPYNTDYQQFAYYPLAWLYTLEHPNNPWKGNPRLLEAVTRSFKNNVSIQKEDGSFVGSSHDAAPFAWPNNWRSFTWLRSWELMRGQIDRDLEKKCEQGLQRALVSLEAHARHQAAEDSYCKGHNVRNHPMWYMLVTLALGRAFKQDKAAAWATEQLERICAAQHPAGLWYEHNGPVMVYQHVSMNALAHYHALTGSPAAQKALDRSLDFFRIFTYPSGYPIETLDGRVRYTGYVLSIPPATWTHSAEGRSYLHFIMDRLLEQPLGPGYQTHGGWLGLPFFTQFARDIPSSENTDAKPVTALVGDGVHQVPNLPVRVIRRGPWTVTVSGFTRPEEPKNRWVLDFQAHLSIHHEKSGLIIGGGGGKRQAAFSLFSGGSRPLGLPCLALEGSADTTGGASARIVLKYPGFIATLDAAVENEAVVVTASATASAPEIGPLFLQLPSPMKGAAPIVTANGARPEMDLQDELLPEEIGAWIGREGLFKISGFDGGRAYIHLLPFNTHWRDGRAPAEKAMSIVALPLTSGVARQIRVTV
jgi:hypothetical protein